LLADGSASSFTIPVVEEFVITDISWQTVCISNPFGGPNCNRSAGDASIITFGDCPLHLVVCTPAKWRT
jgi:hypothetical protein